MARFTYRYYIPENGQGADDAYLFGSDMPLESVFEDSIAEEAAVDYRANHDGWEANWPLDIVLIGDDGKEFGKFSVSCEMEPTFHATRAD